MSVILQHASQKTKSADKIFGELTYCLRGLRESDGLSASEYAYLAQLSPDGNIAMRGVAPSKDGRRNEARWKKINKGDTALVLWRNYVRAVGEVVLRKESPELAKLMGSPKRRDVAAESAYRFVYFLRNLRSLEVPYAELNNKLGFKENNNFQAFDVLDTKKSQAVLELLRSKGAFDARSK